MRTLQRSAVLVGALALCLSALVGCQRAGNRGTSGAALKPGEKVKVGFIVKMPEEPWFQYEWKFGQKCADKYGFQLIKIAGPDGEKVLAAIDNLAAQGAQGFVICTPDVRLGPAIAAKAKAKGLKLFSVDDRFVGSDGKPMKDVPYMGIAAADIGRTVGKALYEEMKRRGWPLEGTAAMAITFDELETTKQRTDGATEALVAAGFPKDRTYRGAEKTTDVPGSHEAANVVLTQHPEVKRWLIFSVNDEGVMGAVRATEIRGFSAKDVIAIGIGGISCVPEFQKKKPTGFCATCLINCVRHGYETTEYMYKWVKEGKEPPKYTLTQGTIITRDTWHKVMKDRGMLD